MDIRAIFYDYARGNWALPEFIHGLIDRAAGMGFNGLWLYLEDVTQFIMPERFGGTLDLAELRRLDDHAKRRGVMLAPMLALLGHAEQSLAHPELAHLAEGTEPRLRGTFDPLNPETRTVLADTLRVAAETFSAPLIGLGCDECWWLGMSRNQASPWPAALFCEHMNWLTQTVCGLGRRAMFFDDMIGRYYPEYAERLDKRLIPVVWFYGQDRGYPTVRQWREQGFDVIVFPSLGYGDGILVGRRAGGKPLPSAGARASGV